ncbi:MAG: hypothetical protein H7X97_05910, partial [Opitutaceae bacterium]|nr:hypothetical protein [Verrucomicrobiales bacterium]
GTVQDEVNYQLGFPWPTVGDAPGYSIELIHSGLDNDLGGSWRASRLSTAPSAETTLIGSGSTWRYFKGITEASSPTTLWRSPAFDDSTWSSGPMPIGYDASLLMATPLTDMNGNYTTVFLRRTFVVTNLANFPSLFLDALYDDGFKVWINGVNVLNANVSTSEVPYTGTSATTREDNSWATNSLPNPGSYVVTGTNIIAIQLVNTLLSGSSDCFLDLKLRGVESALGNGPTPGRTNAIFATNAPPQIRQVDHSPEQPKSGQSVLISAKVTDPHGVASVTLEYQIVNPGGYIESTDAEYTANWTSLSMNDAGTGGDLAAGDGTYSATLTGGVQQHRRLIRYRIVAQDATGLSIRVPYLDDPQPNFAYFVYDSIPAWTGAVNPGDVGALGQTFTVSSNEMARLPAYHLIAKRTTVETATWFSRYGGDAYLWSGTLVYDGKVYDHIHYRARGGVWRYAMGKNMWKFDFNRGHDFEPRDNWGKKYSTPWHKLNLGASIQQGNFNHRGEQGLFESIGMKLFQLTGIAAPNTSYVQFRIVDDVDELNGASQWDGDFWGVYLALEQEDGQFLDEHNLPDSNYYKMEAGTGELNNLSPNGPTDKSDLNYFLSNYT